MQVALAQAYMAEVHMAEAYMAEQVLVMAPASRSPQISPGRKEQEADLLVFEELDWVECHLACKELGFGLKGLVCAKAKEED